MVCVCLCIRCSILDPILVSTYHATPANFVTAIFLLFLGDAAMVESQKHNARAKYSICFTLTNNVLA